VAGCVVQPFQISQVVGVGKEAGLAVVPALHDVQGHAIKVDAGAAGHGEYFNRAWPLLKHLLLI